MALAPYYDKAAVAASQVVAGFDHVAFEAKLRDTVVGLSFSSEDLGKPQGGACVDLALRLLARLYPTLAILGDDGCVDKVEALKTLATRINPRIEFADRAPIGITIGAGAPWDSTVFVGSSAWQASVSTESPQDVGSEDLPFGAGIAACLGAGAIFRMLFLGDPCDGTSTLACFEPGTEPDIADASAGSEGRSALVGLGAIGQAVLWALARSPVEGGLHCVDGETFDMSNLQRYVLTTTGDVGKPKADFATEFLGSAPATGGELHAIAINSHWPDAVEEYGPVWNNVLVAVDSAAARCEVQSTLPFGVLNAWTQAGDLGVSEHNFLNGACLACLYLPTRASTNEDEIVATALGVPEQVLQIRELLYRDMPPPPELLDLIAERLDVDREVAAAFAGRSVRQLYVEGICGGALVPAGAVGGVIHVPLAHQSALAGVLLAAHFMRRTAGYTPATTEVTRIDVRRVAPTHPYQRASKDPRGICICQDDDYIDVFKSLWS